MNKTASAQMGRFRQIERQIAQVFNRYSVDNDFNIPDFILARLVMRHLQALMQMNHELHIWRKNSILENESLNTDIVEAERGTDEPQTTQQP